MEQVKNGSSTDDLPHLQRLYRITEGDRRAYCRDTKITLLRQRKVIHKLEHEKEEILSKFQQKGSYQYDSREEEIINSLLEVYQRQKRKLQSERQFVQNQRSEIQHLEKEIQRLQILPPKLPSQPQAHKPEEISRKLKILEDKLETAFIQFNRLSHRNIKLRETIEHLMKQRATYKKIWKHLGDTAQQFKNEIKQLTFSATESYNKRDEAYQKFQAAKISQARDQRACCSQLEEAQRVVQQQKSFVEFISTKSQKRLPKTVEGEVGALMDTDRTHKMATNVQDESQQKWNRNQLEMTANTELFTYVSNLNNKVEELQGENAKLQEEIDGMKERQISDVLSDEGKVKELEQEIATVMKSVNEVEAHLGNATKTLLNLRAGIESMLQLVGGDVTATTVAEHNKGEISKPAILRALKEIEFHVNELLQTRQFMDNQEQLISHDQEGKTSPLSQIVSQADSFRPIREDSYLEVYTLSMPSLSDGSQESSSHPADHVPVDHAQPVTYNLLLDQNYVTSGRSGASSRCSTIKDRSSKS